MKTLRGWQANLLDLSSKDTPLTHSTSFEFVREGPKSSEQAGREGCVPYLRLDHVDTPGAEGLHTVVNVHNTLTLGHVQHHIQNNVAACTACARTGERAARCPIRAREGSPGPRGGEEGAWGIWPCLHLTEAGGQRDMPPHRQGEVCGRSCGEM